MIKNEIPEYIRTLVRGDLKANKTVEETLDKIGWDGWPAFLGATFYLAIQRHFGGKFDEAAAINLVATMRTHIKPGGPRINPADAELLIRAVFDSNLEPEIELEDLGHIETVAIFATLSQANLSDDELDGLLAEARTIAETYS